MRARWRTKKRGEGSKAHSKELRARRRTQKEMRAQRHTKKRGEGLKAHLKENEGSKAYSKGWSRA